MAGTAQSLLLALPDSCVLAILQCLAAEDQRSLFTAARVHSRLHQAAVAALSGITVTVVDQQQMDGVLLYLNKHGQHVDSIQLFGVNNSEEEGVLELDVKLRQLPFNLQPSRLQLQYLQLQLLPSAGFQGVQGAAAVVAALQQLRLSDCALLDGEEQLAAALWQLPPGLQHLSINGLLADGSWVQVPTGVLQRLQQLTYLELARCSFKSAVEGEPALQPLQALTLLQDLRLAADDGYYDKRPADDARLDASMLSGTHGLTRLEVSGKWHEGTNLWFEPRVLAGKTQLQHLQLSCDVDSITGGAQLMSQLQPLQQLTHLGLPNTTWWEEDMPAAALSALTASSKLQHLDIGRLHLPPGAWQHVFPASRQLPHLSSLNIAGITQPEIPSRYSAPEGSRLVGCCPGLQALHIQQLRNNADMLFALRGLSGLHTLGMDSDCSFGLLGLLDLTDLRGLSVYVGENGKQGLLYLTELKQLTALTYMYPRNFRGSDSRRINLACQVSCKLGRRLFYPACRLWL
jgi:hypothetical protein